MSHTRGTRGYTHIHPSPSPQRALLSGCLRAQATKTTVENPTSVAGRRWLPPQRMPCPCTPSSLCGPRVLITSSLAGQFLELLRTNGFCHNHRVTACFPVPPAQQTRPSSPLHFQCPIRLACASQVAQPVRSWGRDLCVSGLVLVVQWVKPLPVALAFHIGSTSSPAPS